jgi:hypothetical protein
LSKKNAEANAGQTEPDQVVETEAVKTEEVAEPVFTQKQVEEEKSKVQSAFEKKLAAERREKEATAGRLSEMEKLIQVATAKQKQVEDERESRFLEEIESLPEGQKMSALYRKLKEREERLDGLERAAGEKYQAGEYGLKVSHAHKFAEDYGIEWKTLMDAKDERGMETMALKLKAENLEKELEAVKSAPKPKKTEEPEEDEVEDKNPVHIDSGTRTTGQPKRLFSVKEIEAMDLETFKQYEPQIMRQMGEGKIKT